MVFYFCVFDFQESCKIVFSLVFWRFFYFCIFNFQESWGILYFSLIFLISRGFLIFAVLISKSPGILFFCFFVAFWFSRGFLLGVFLSGRPCHEKPPYLAFSEDALT